MDMRQSKERDVAPAARTQQGVATDALVAAVAGGALLVAALLGPMLF
jgi:hypothetical protein